MKTLLIAILIATSLTKDLDFPELDEFEHLNLDIPVSDSIEVLTNSLIAHQWEQAIPAGVSLLKSMHSWATDNKKTVPQLFGGLLANKQPTCPYTDCVKERFCKLDKVGKIYGHLVWHGENEKARKLIGCISSILEWATHCGDHKNHKL